MFGIKYPILLGGLYLLGRGELEERGPVVESPGRSPEAVVAPLHAGGVKIMHKVAGVRFARTTERLGCDAVCVVGYECGGHPGLDNVTTLGMVPLAGDAGQIPVVAGGGCAAGGGGGGG